ncbi:amidohydrolase family protein [Parashewanella curva]|nr:amidohydrolase family protein [Parashewanella curva]
MKFNKPLLLILSVLFTSMYSQQSLSETLAVTGATIHTSSSKGVVTNGTLLIENGKIKALGQSIRIPSKAERIDATGKHITAGIIYPASQIGLFDLPGNPTADVQSAKGSDLNAAYRIDYAFNHNAIAIAENRRHGVTRAITVPTSSGKLFHGSGVVIKLSGDYNTILEQGPMKASLKGIGNRNIAWERLYRIMGEVKYFEENQSAVKKGKDTTSFTLSDRNMRALFPIIQGDKPLLLEVNNAIELMQAIKFKQQYDIKLVITGAAEAWKVASELAKANIPVLINPQENRPVDFDKLGARYDNAALLDKAGVLFAFTYENGNQRAFLVRQSAGIAVAHGLPHESALKAITTNPAKIFNLSKVGELSKNKVADFVIWDGDPLEVTTNADAVFIEGQAYKLESRRTKLRDKYLSSYEKKSK